VTLPAGTYWIVLQGGGGDQGAIRFGASAAGAEAWNADSFSDGLSDPFGTASVGNWQWSLYASYSSSSSTSPPQNTSSPTISGMPMQGQTLTENDGAWSGNPPPTLTRQWQRCASGTCHDITNASGKTYLVSSADVGFTLRIEVSGVNSAGSATADSAQTATVTVTGPPQNTSLPTIGGPPQVGKTLNASTGSWSGSPTSYTYQWLRCTSSGGNCGNIVGAGSSSYVVRAVDVGFTFRVEITATNSVGSATATSAATRVVKR
jgi:hypothetical protein